MKNYVIYKRVSTRRQGDSGLGLEAQQTAVEAFLKGKDSEVVGEFVEVESGRKKDRPELIKALALCKAENATLIVARTDRLSRNVQKIEFIACDNPSANNFTLHIMAAVAEQEALLISKRTKAALAAAKKRGVKLGSYGKLLAQENKVNADNFADSMISSIKTAAADSLKKHNKVTLQSVSSFLNKRKVKTARGGKWYPTSVKNLLDRLGRDLQSFA